MVAAAVTAKLNLYTSTNDCDAYGGNEEAYLTENQCYNFKNYTVASASFDTLTGVSDSSLGCYGVVYEYPGCVGQASLMRGDEGIAESIQSDGEPFVCADGALNWSDGGKNISSALFTCLHPGSSC